MVEARYCDSCGIRLPLDLEPGDPCPSCGYQLTADAFPAGQSEARVRRTTTTARLPATSPRQSSARARPSSRQTPVPVGNKSNAVHFAVALVAGLLVALAAGLLIAGRRKAPPPAPVTSADGAPTVGAADASRGDGPPPPGPEAAASVVADLAAELPPLTEGAPKDETPPPENVTAPAAPDAGDDDDFFANLRAQSEARRKARETAVTPSADTPPLPNVYVSDLQPRYEEVGWGGNPKMNRSIGDNPLRLNGTEYNKGIGAHSPSRLVFPVEPRYGRFVASAGIDDEASAEGSVTFEIYADGKILAASRTLRRGQIWHVNVEVPEGAKELEIAISQAGDGDSWDHADWVNAGFITD